MFLGSVFVGCMNLFMRFLRNFFGFNLVFFLVFLFFYFFAVKICAAH